MSNVILKLCSPPALWARLTNNDVPRGKHFLSFAIIYVWFCNTLCIIFMKVYLTSLFVPRFSKHFLFLEPKIEGQKWTQWYKIGGNPIARFPLEIVKMGKFNNSTFIEFLPICCLKLSKTSKKSHVVYEPYRVDFK